MKWLFFLISMAAIPPLVLLLRGNPKLISRAFILIGFLPFLFKTTKGLDMALFSWDTRDGFVHGFELTVVDILAFAIYASLPRPRQPIPFKVVFGLYLAAIFVSLFEAQHPLAASFYLWQFARVAFLYVVIVTACADHQVPKALLTGMGLGLALQLVMVVHQRFGLGWLQAPGTFEHQNQLGMVLNLALLPNFALVLAGSRNWIALLSPAIGSVAAVFTTSRATIGLTAAGLSTLYLLLSVRRFTRWRAAIGLAGFAALLALTPAVYSSFMQRFESSPLSRDYGERAAFARAALMMFDENPMGVGANHYVEIANAKGYSQRAGVYSSHASRSAHVHNIYLLVLAETGYIGLATFLLLLLRPMWVAFRCGWQHPRDQRGALLIGLGTALLIAACHSMFEWIFITIQTQYFFAIILGLIAGLSQQLNFWPEAPQRLMPWQSAPASSF